MNNRFALAAPLAGLAIGAHAQTTTISITASTSTITVGNPVTWTVSVSTDLTGGDPLVFSDANLDWLLTELRAIVLALGISDAKLEEGSMRCDANISLRGFSAMAVGKKSVIYLAFDSGKDATRAGRALKNL